MKRKINPNIDDRPKLIIGPISELTAYRAYALAREEYRATEILMAKTEPDTFKVPRSKRHKVVIFHDVSLQKIPLLLNISAKIPVIATVHIDPSLVRNYIGDLVDAYRIIDLTPQPNCISEVPYDEDIQITISKDRAQLLSHRLSDILCWAEGFKAGVRSVDEYSSNLGPFNQGINAVRDIQDILKRKLE